MFVTSYLQTATLLFNTYLLQEPLAIYLKKYFKSNSKFGSRDRKMIGSLLYGIYRIGNNNNHLEIQDRMLIGCYLSGSMPILFFEKTNILFAKNYELDFIQKKDLVIKNYQINFEIPYKLTTDISAAEYTEYLFKTSNVFIRIINNRQKIIDTLQQKEVFFTQINDNCLSFTSNIKLHEVLPNTDEYIVQDISSQMTFDILSPKDNESWWDCCAGSGGKSILLLTKNNNIQHTVSDNRESILKNLKERLNNLHFTNFESKVVDLQKNNTMDNMYDNIILDAPCSGSGNWGRCPEQYYFFSNKKLEDKAKLQKNILQNALSYLKSGGHLYYFTCSIFEMENENIVNLLDSNQYQILQNKLLKGNSWGGDFIYSSVILKK